MKNIARIGVLSVATFGMAAAAQSTDVATFLKQRCAEDAGLRLMARSPIAAVTPISLFEKDSSVPSCGILVAVPHADKPRYIELIGAEPGVDFPQCVGISSITLFRLQGQNYVMVEYSYRDTREDTYRGFRYLVEAAGAGFVSDEKIYKGIQAKASRVAHSAADPTRTLEGIQQARAVAMKASFPQWRFLERDFIADSASSFATFEDGKSHGCFFAVEAGAKPVSENLLDMTGDTRCAGVLASSRLATPVATYYLALVKADTGRHSIGIVSVAADGSIRIEKQLSDDLNRADATRDMKTAKAALTAHLEASTRPVARRPVRPTPQ